MIAKLDSLKNVVLLYVQAEDVDQLDKMANGIRSKDAVFYFNGALKHSGSYSFTVSALGLLSFEDKIGLLTTFYEGETEKWNYVDFSSSSFSPEPVVVLVAVDSLLNMISVAEKEQAARKMNKEISTEAQQAITQIRKSYDVRLQTYGWDKPYSFQQAVRDANFSESVLQNWTFSVKYTDRGFFSFNKIIAVSTSSNPAGEGKIVWYDIDDAKFHGFGIDEFEYHD